MSPAERTDSRKSLARWVIKDLVLELGRDPGHADLADALGMTAQQLNSWLGFIARRGRSVSEDCDTLWREAGIPERPLYNRGGKGRPGRVVTP